MKIFDRGKEGSNSCMKRPREATEGELTITMEGGLRRVAPYWFK